MEGREQLDRQGAWGQVFQAQVFGCTAWEETAYYWRCSFRDLPVTLLSHLGACFLPLQVFHEQGILFGYRHPQSSATACILSLFQMTNETLNIWTHLLPFWYLPAPLTSRLIQDPWELGLL